MSQPIVMTSHTLVDTIYTDLRQDITSLTQAGRVPELAVVLVGHDPNSETYVAVKQQQAEKLGIAFTLHRLDETANEEAVLGVIDQLNHAASVTGIIIQLPLPNGLDTERIVNAVVKEKDVDGLSQGSPFVPPTVSAILELLGGYDIILKDKNIVVVGQGRLVGAPLTSELKTMGLSVTVCDAKVSDLAACTLEADILISATGKKHLIKPSMVKEGAVVIDVDEEVVYDEVMSKVSYITPQRGGVGPLTVAFLLSNVVEAASAKAH